MSAAGQSEVDGRRLSVTSLLVSLLSLLVSLVVATVVIYVYTTSEGVGLASRLQELEGLVGREGRVSRVCLLPPDPGPCTSSVRRYYFLPRLADCIQFPYGGCQGNDNNFLSLLQCRETCGVSSSSSSSSSSPLSSSVLISSTVRPPAWTKPDEDCLLAADSGPCTDRLARFYYDSQSGHCQR